MLDNDPYIGKVLKQDVFNYHGVLIMPAQTHLDHIQIEKINKHHVLLEPSNVYRESYEAQSAIIDQSVVEVEEIFGQIRENRIIPLLDIRTKIMPKIQEVADQPHLFGLFTLLHEKDDYTYRHNIGVGVISHLFGRWLDLDEQDLAQLTLAATLHDVGKVQVPEEILNKPGKYLEEEYEYMKMHTSYGYALLKKTIGITHRQALVALQHHERLDGSGYPLGLRGVQIDFFGRIVAIADVFHAMTSNRQYKKPSSFYDALQEIYKHSYTIFDPKIASVFIGKMMEQTIGMRAMLTDGTVGVVVMINPTYPLSPLIKKGVDFQDLSKDFSVQIDHIIV